MSKHISKHLMLTVGLVAMLSSCKKDGNPNDLPDVSPEQYAGTVDGFKSSDEVYTNNLVAYWSFDNNRNELKTNTAPTASANDALVAGGVRGQALSLNGGYLLYGTQFPQFRTDALKSFTISMWVQILNNGSKKTQIFQLARPGMLNGNIDFILETELNPPSNTDYIRIRGYFTTVGGGRQDNVNAFGAQNRSPKFGATKWTHLVLSYNQATAVFHIWGDGEKIGNFPNRSTAANNLFKSWEPNQVILGGNYSVIPGQPVTPATTAYAPMTGKIDEVRVYDVALPDAFVVALYKLGMVGQ